MKKLFIVLPLALLVIAATYHVENCFAGNSSIKILDIEPNTSKCLRLVVKFISRSNLNIM